MLKILPQFINEQAIKICHILNEHDCQAYIVGGCVRDLLLGVNPKDWDITTDASPEKVMEIFPKTYPTGLQHGTVTVAMGEGIENHFEVTTFRIEGEYKDGRRPEEVIFVMNVEQDLARRDLTINAMAYDPISNYLIDPFGGIEDLKNKLIRAVGDPNIRFQEDGLRIMRVARFAARFGYSIDPATLAGMKANLNTLRKVSKERIKDELCKILMSKAPSHGLEILSDCKALEIACPLYFEMDSLLCMEQERCQGDLETRIAFFYADLSLAKIHKELLYLKFSNKEIKRVMFLIELIHHYQKLVEKDTILSYRSFLAVIKNHAPDPWEYSLEQFIILTEALALHSRQLLSKYSSEIVFARNEMKIDGNDLMANGISPGPKLKKILDECYLEILRNPEHNTKDFLIKMTENQ